MEKVGSSLVLCLGLVAVTIGLYGLVTGRLLLRRWLPADGPDSARLSGAVTVLISIGPSLDPLRELTGLPTGIPLVVWLAVMILTLVGLIVWKLRRPRNSDA